MLSRSSSSSSMRSARGGSAKAKPSYICHPIATNSQFNKVISQLPLEGWNKSKKCPECRTATAEGAMTLLNAIRNCPNMKQVDSTTLRQLGQFLFDRLAMQRRSTTNGFKERWDDFLAAFAEISYLVIPIPELRNVCSTIKSKYGMGMDKQVLQTLAKAACIENRVWETVEFKTHTDNIIFSSVNGSIMLLRERLSQVDKFDRVEDVFRCAEALGTLADSTSSTMTTIMERFAKWDKSGK
ncbi:hypothetical protein BJ170DRAFT_620221 [Xylariales sp. AK1849]|nr:hypothetical protein BJ170DRAFT_620221 [Xylariales sp. AK1849]